MEILVKNTASLVSSTSVVSTQMPMIKATGDAPLFKNMLYKHGMNRTKIHRRWCAIIGRTINPNQDGYKYYGGRGIKVCDEWRHNFMAFYTWAMANGYKDELQIDRIDTNGNYEPSNCRFVTATVNQRNKRKKHDYGIRINSSGNYCVMLTRNHKHCYVGTAKTKEAAIILRDAFLKNEDQLLAEFKKLNLECY